MATLEQEQVEVAKEREKARQDTVLVAYDAKVMAEVQKQVDAQKVKEAKWIADGKAAEAKAAAAAKAASPQTPGTVAGIEMLYAPIMALKAKVDTGSVISKEDIWNLWDIAVVVKGQVK